MNASPLGSLPYTLRAAVARNTMEFNESSELDAGNCLDRVEFIEDGGIRLDVGGKEAPCSALHWFGGIASPCF